jgi:hypothetical protein
MKAVHCTFYFRSLRTIPSKNHLLDAEAEQSTTKYVETHETVVCKYILEAVYRLI